MKTIFSVSSPTLAQTQFLYSMAETSTYLSSLLCPSIFPPQQPPLIVSKEQQSPTTATSSSSNCMNPFSNLESHLDLPFKRHCIACKQVCETQEFYQRHILIQAVVFYQEDDLVTKTCILRNCLTRGKHIFYKQRIESEVCSSHFLFLPFFFGISWQIFHAHMILVHVAFVILKNLKSMLWNVNIKKFFLDRFNAKSSLPPIKQW